MGEGVGARSNSLTFYIPFWQKRYYYTYPFDIPTLEHCTPFSALEWTILREIVMTSITRRNVTQTTSVIYSVDNPFKHLNDQFPYPLCIPQVAKSSPFYIPKAWKRYPFRVGPPRIGHYRKYPSRENTSARDCWWSVYNWALITSYQCVLGLSSGFSIIHGLSLLFVLVLSLRSFTSLSWFSLSEET